MGIVYDYKHLDLISVTTVSNIITFVQFALVPLEKAKEHAEVLNEEFTTVNFSPFVQALMAPFDFITTFMNIAPPMRTLLTAVILISLFSLMVLSFFFPAWRLIIFLADVIFPCIGMYGAMFIYKDYKLQMKVGRQMCIIGITYVCIRVVVFIVMKYKDWKDIDWGTRVARHATSLFMSRIKNDRNPEELEEMANTLNKAIDSHDSALNFANYKRMNKISDVAISITLLLTVVILQFVVTYRKLVSFGYTGVQLEDMVKIFDLISYFLIGFLSLRLLIAILFSFEGFVPILLKMKRYGFVGINFVIGLILIPIVNLVLQSTMITSSACPYNEYYDFNRSQSSFVAYFSFHKAGCRVCKNASYNKKECADQCVRNGTYNINHAASAAYLSETELSETYTIPITLLEVYFLFILNNLLETMFKRSKDICEAIPAPTTNTETKFASVLVKLTSKGASTFSSYTHQKALFSFDFTQTKMFILFLTSLFPLFPVPEVRKYSNIIICVVFVIACFAFACTNLFSSPYKSRLHNWVNGLSYFVGSLTSAIALLRVLRSDISEVIGTLAYCLVIATPVLTTLLIPLIIKYDITKSPVNYTLGSIKKRERKLRKRRDSSSDGEASDDPDFRVEMSLLNIAPTYIQLGIDSNQRNYTAQARKVYPRAELVEKTFVEATDELFSIINHLLDASSYGYIKTILSISTIYVSLCFGWGLGLGVANWKLKADYLRCDVDDINFYK